MTLCMNEVQEVIENIARKYSRNTSISREDFVQDLWVKALELDGYGVCMANLKTSLVNYAIDLSRADWKKIKSESCCLNGDAEYTEVFLCNNSREYSHNTQSLEGYLTIVESIRTLSERERIFAVTKAYLNGGFDEFAEDFAEICRSIPEDRLEMLRQYDKKEFSDDIILKVFLGIRTGTNSCSARLIKWHTKLALTEVTE